MNPSDDIFLECLVQIKGDEGFSAHVYPDHLGVWTIGFGRNVDKEHGGPGITEAEAAVMLSNDINVCDDDLRKLFPCWDTLSLRWRATLLNLRYQLGPQRFRGFKNMIACVNHGDGAGAARELRDSALYKQTTKRTERRAQELEAQT